MTSLNALAAECRHRVKIRLLSQGWKLPGSAGSLLLEKRAQELLNSGQVQSAEEMFTLLKARPGYEDTASSGLALVYQAQDRWDEAAEILKKLYASDRRNRSFAARYGTALTELGRSAEYLQLLLGDKEMGLLNDEDSFQLAKLEAQQSNRVLDHQTIKLFYKKSQESFAISSAYFSSLINLGLLTEAEVVLNEFAKNFPNRSGKLNQYRARLDRHMPSHQQLAKPRKSDTTFGYPRTSPKFARQLRQLMVQRKTGQAFKLVQKEKGFRDNIHVLKIETEILLAHGDATGAVKTAIQAVRLCENYESLSQLHSALISKGWIVFADHVADYISARKPDTLGKYETLAAIELERGHWCDARDWAAQNLVHDPLNTICLQVLAEASFQMGDTERSYGCGLALATQDPRFYAEDPAIRELATSDTRSKIQSIADSLPEEDGAIIDEDMVEALSAIMPNKHAFKAYPRSPSHVDACMKKLKQVEDEGGTAAVFNDMEASAELVLSTIASQASAGAVCARVADLSRKAGNLQEAHNWYERACFVNKRSSLYVTRMKRFIAETSPKYMCKSPDRVAILLLSCAPNLSRARVLAAQLHDASGKDVILLWAKDDQSGFTLEDRDFGAELVVPCSDGYQALPRKILLAYRFLAVNTNCRGVFKIDDDVFVHDGPRMKSMIDMCSQSGASYLGNLTKLNSAVYHHGRNLQVGEKRRVAVHSQVEYCNGAGGYYLSRSALREILVVGLREYGVPNHPAVFEDVMIGEILHRVGIRPIHLNTSRVGGYSIDVYEPMSLLKRGVWE